MNTVIVFFLVLVAVSAFLLFFGSRRRDEFTRLGARIDEISKTVFSVAQQVDARLREAAEAAERGQNRATEALTRVSGHLGEQREMFQRVSEVQRDLKRFQDLLQPPKSRGGIGERMLEQLLSDMMPEGEGVGQYHAQHAFKGGERVDFVIRLRDFFVPIDAKFPLEAYERMRNAEADEDRVRASREFRQAVKQHIDAVARKYIRPDEGTSDFAFLYIPSEAVYLGILEDGEIVDYAFDQRVIVVSPGTFFAYLRTVLIGLRGFAVEASAKQLLATLGRLEGDLSEFLQRFRVVGGHVRNAGKAYEEAERQLVRITDAFGQWKKISSVHEEGDA